MFGNFWFFFLNFRIVGILGPGHHNTHHAIGYIGVWRDVPTDRIIYQPGYKTYCISSRHGTMTATRTHHNNILFVNGPRRLKIRCARSTMHEVRVCGHINIPPISVASFMSSSFSLRTHARKRARARTYRPCVYYDACMNIQSGPESTDQSLNQILFNVIQQMCSLFKNLYSFCMRFKMSKFPEVE